MLNIYFHLKWLHSLKMGGGMWKNTLIDITQNCNAYLLSVILFMLYALTFLFTNNIQYISVIFLRNKPLAESLILVYFLQI